MRTIDGVVQAALKIMKSKGWSAPVAVKHVLKVKDLSPEQIETAVHQAVVARVNMERANERWDGPKSAAKNTGLVLHPPRGEARLRLLSSLEYNVDGKPKYLIKFTIPDLVQWVQTCETKASTYKAQARFGRDLKAELERRKVKTVGQLPKTVLEDYERKAARVWGQRSVSAA